MLKKILEKFGYISLQEHNHIVGVLFKQKEAMEKEIFLLNVKVTSFEEAEKKFHPLVDFSLGDPAPKDSEQRKTYVARTAGFFSEILEPKLKSMLSSLHNMLEERDSDRDFDLILKGVAYAFRDLIKWGNAMINEQVANQNINVSEGDVENLKEKLKT